MRARIFSCGVAPTAKVPTSQSPDVPSYVPSVVVELTRLSPAGNRSRTIKLVAASGPALASETVKTISSPTKGVVAVLSVLLSETSTLWACNEADPKSSSPFAVPLPGVLSRSNWSAAVICAAFVISLVLVTIAGKTSRVVCPLDKLGIVQTPVDVL